MKKILSVLFAALMITAAFSGCSGKTEENKENVSETAESFVDVSSANASISLNEDTARSLLGSFDKKILQLSDDLSSYTLKLSGEKIMSSDGCKVEAYKKGSTAPEKTYGIVGSDCYIFDESKQKYLLLTEDGTVELISKSANESGFVYDKDNSNAILTMFKQYPKEKLGLSKELADYVYIASAEVSKDSSGKVVYVINVYEKDGSQTGVKIGFNEVNRYVFNSATGEYEILK